MEGAHQMQQRRRSPIMLLGIVFGAAVMAVLVAACSQSQAPAGGSGSGGGQEVTTASGLKYEDTKVGTGAEAKAGQQVSVHYTGWLTNGTKFDSSKDRGQPFVFPLGGGRVIKGWDEGVQGMKVGGVRKLTIPANLGYGAQGAGGVIPPNATLVFEVELLDVK
jgi:FKBP-type peptidyl-prolyl cis-trans isomerase FkpA